MFLSYVFYKAQHTQKRNYLKAENSPKRITEREKVEKEALRTNGNPCCSIVILIPNVSKKTQEKNACAIKRSIHMANKCSELIIFMTRNPLFPIVVINIRISIFSYIGKSLAPEIIQNKNLCKFLCNGIPRYCRQSV